MFSFVASQYSTDQENTNGRKVCSVFLKPWCVVNEKVFAFASVISVVFFVCSSMSRGVTKGGTISRAPNHWGTPKSPNNGTNTFFNTVHLIPKELRFEYGGAELASCPGATQLRYAPDYEQMNLIQTV